MMLIFPEFFLTGHNSENQGVLDQLVGRKRKFWRGSPRPGFICLFWASCGTFVGTKISKRAEGQRVPCLVLTVGYALTASPS